ncbi:MAG: DegV family protein [Clostridia bacterium]|nr:DegV family protein [Clostridia bacterium]
MQIVSDRGMDASTTQLEGLDVHLAPLTFTLDGKSYRSGVDISSEDFYTLLDESKSYPITSQPSPGDFADIYRGVAAVDPEILSIHISSGLSGTINAARMGAAMVPEANVTFYDTKTLSGAEGWHVEAAAKAAKAGWAKDAILRMLEQVTSLTETLYTIATLKYLIHGGRISHLKGLLASVLNVKPIIGVEKARGTYVNVGQARTLDRAISMLADMVAQRLPAGSGIRVQVMHGNNLSGAENLCARLQSMFSCTWLPTMSIAPVLGAHTGSGLVGVVFAPDAAFPQIP